VPGCRLRRGLLGISASLIIAGMKALSIVGLVLIATLRTAWCGETNHDFAKWEKEISAFETNDKTNPPPKGAFLFIGSSTVRMWKTLPEDFPNVKVINRGFGGSQIVDSTHFAERVIFPYEPSRIFLRAGGNDLWAGKSPEEVFGDFKDFVAKVHGKLPKTEIVFIGWNPTVARWKQADKEKALNTMVQEFVKQNPGLKYIETYPLPLGPDGQPRPELFLADKLHFNAEGYKLLAECVRPFVKK
jgi:lysophospholipase L1-like esterase